MGGRRNNRQSGVRGPNSALTEFLRVEGITDTFRRRREEQDVAEEEVQSNVADRVDGNEEMDQSALGPEIMEGSLLAIGSSRNIIEEEIEDMVKAAKKKRRMARRRGDEGAFPSDDDDDPSYSDDDYGEGRRKKFGETDSCVMCGSDFRVSVYSRYDKANQGYLCEQCNEKVLERERNSRRNQMNARRKRKKLAKALLDKRDVSLPKLQDICIKKISDNIDDVEVLGDIGQVNYNKISRILTKNRSLNNFTISLFLNPDIKHLEFWDCSNVDSDSLNKVAAYCPHLKSLKLYMCGQFHNDNLEYYGKQLQALSELALDGPFLISDIAWQTYFETYGSRLTKFEVRNTHRFGNDSFISLLDNCGSNLVLLKLSKLAGLNSAAVYDLLPHYVSQLQLKVLEISYPASEDLITDEMLINLLAITGESLASLNLDGCTGLTDRFLTEGVTQFCPNLTHLSLVHLDQLTDEGFSSAFRSYHIVNSGGLISVNLTKCTNLSVNAIDALLRHSASTLVELSINSIHNITKHYLFQILSNDNHPIKEKIRRESAAVNGTSGESEGCDKPSLYEKIEFPLLTSLDVSFVRAVDDEILELISRNCSKLNILEVFGNNRCTSNVATRNGLLIIGRQHDVI